MNSGTLSLKTIINELDLQEKTVIIQKTRKKEIYNCLELNQWEKKNTQS